MLHVFLKRLQLLDPAGEVRLLIFGSPKELWLPPEVKVTVTFLGSGELLRNLVWADIFVWVGGTCLHQYGYATFLNGTLARLLRTKVYWIGVGVDDIVGKWARLKAWVALAPLSGATFRDAYSQARALEIRPSLRADIAEDLVYLLTEEPWFKAVSTSDRCLVVSWLEFHPLLDSEERWADAFATLIPDLVERLNINVVQIVNMSGYVDARANGYLAEAIERFLVETNHNVRLERHLSPGIQGTIDLLQRATFVFSVRMHGVLVSKLLGVPAAGIAYANKSKLMAEKFDGPLLLSFASLEQTPTAAVDLIVHEYRAPAPPARSINACRDAARRNVDVLREWISGSYRTSLR